MTIKPIYIFVMCIQVLQWYMLNLNARHGKINENTR